MWRPGGRGGAAGEVGFGVGEGPDPPGEVVGGLVGVEGSVLGGGGEGVGDVEAGVVGGLEGAGELVPADGVGGEPRVVAVDQGGPASGDRGAGEPVADLAGGVELLVGDLLGVVGPGSDGGQGDGVAEECGVGVEPVGDPAQGGFPGVGGLGGEDGGEVPPGSWRYQL